MNEESRRLHRRYIVNLPGKICSEQQQPELNVINLSVDGAMILCSRELNAWENLWLEVEFSAKKKLRLPIGVCWAEAGLAGVKFLHPDAEAAAFLDWYVANLEPVGLCDVLG